MLIHRVGCHFFEAEQLAQPLPLLAKNRKQDTSLSSNTSHFKPSLYMQALSQPIGALVSGAEAAEMKPQLLMSGCVPACVGVLLFMCLHVWESFYFSPACMFVYFYEACTPAHTVQRLRDEGGNLKMSLLLFLSLHSTSSQLSESSEFTKIKTVFESA